ncbi:MULTISPECIES: hypothetical protein [unclassified Leucobacter]|uniref:hypothetical protein n=1 Tax=unclassified Leucobacter TaxID=2621730 RepID=UPI00062212B9|nr:hypothetical protein [Leucobacter sp. Ag1]KKI16368.1 hypothetical protein XM48_16360 [Leucobacter sp. Ag1]
MAKPAAPVLSSVTVNTDTRAVLIWTRPANYNRIEIERAPALAGPWTLVASIRQAGITTATDQTIVKDSVYFYRVRGVNIFLPPDDQASDWSNIVGPRYTTPGPAVIGEPKWTATGNISIPFTPPAAAVSMDVLDNGTVVATSVPVTSPYTYVGPSQAAGHSLSLRTKNPTGQTLYGPQGVGAVAPPLMPFDMVPITGYVADDAPVRFSWRHNSSDTSPQIAAEVQYRLSSSPTWITVSVGQNEFVDVDLPVGGYVWRVRTRGLHATFSSWSLIRSFDVITRPTVNLVTPSGPVWTLPALPVEWVLTQAQGLPQHEWAVELHDAAGVPIEFRGDRTGETVCQLANRFADGTSWALRVRAATGGVWSPWVEIAFTVDYVEPALPVLTAVWNDDDGCMEIAVSAGTGAGLPATDHMDVERSDDGGATWLPIISGSHGGSVIDRESPSGSIEVLYRATAFSDIGAAAVTIVGVVPGSQAVWLAGGPSFTVVARLPFSPEIEIEAGRERDALVTDDSELPTPFAGEWLSRTVDASGAVLDRAPDNATVAKLVALAQAPEPLHFYRDPDGRCIYGILSAVRMPRKAGGLWQYGWKLEETKRG